MTMERHNKRRRSSSSSPDRNKSKYSRNNLSYKHKKKHKRHRSRSRSRTRSPIDKERFCSKSHKTSKPYRSDSSSRSRNKDYFKSSKNSSSYQSDYRTDKDYFRNNERQISQDCVTSERFCNKDVKRKEQKDGSDGKTSSDSEKEISFDWDDYKWELNQMFFKENDSIKKDTDGYNDFWKFLKKYTGLQKQKRVRDMCSAKLEEKPVDKGMESELHNLPLKYDKRYNINFALKADDIDLLRSRLPPRDLEDGSKRLSRKKLVEFKFIILLYLDFMQKKKFEKLKKLREGQANLPIAVHRSEIVETVKNNNIVIIAGDTGCGKSTQVPQYLLSAGFKNIACTQPRRLACISLSNRVAYETLNEYGSKVGYQIRFEKRKTEHTNILFLTEGLLLRQVTTDPVLGLYDVVILDEIHERHLHTDFLLGVMKCLIMQRQDIKVILMSATINIDLFKGYFMNKVPVIQVPGRLYPIKMQYFPIPIVEQTSKSDKINPAPYIRVLQLIDNKYPEDERGDVLVFLSGMSEISTVAEAAETYAQQSHKWIILPLHSTLSVTEQEKVFDIPPDGVRKCIISTNIAETSITIDGVRFVIDSGKVKEMNFDSNSKMQKLKEFWISQASAEQRKGRAGRTGPGICFRLFSEEEYNSFSPYSAPEIQRVPLDNIVLQMISMGLPDIQLFPFIEPPSAESLKHTLDSLKSHDALTSNQELTTIGRLLSQLPMDIALGKMLIMGSLFHQVDPVLSLAAAMSVQSPFTNRAYRDPDCSTAIKNLESDHGDPFTLLCSYREWLKVKLQSKEESRRWCRRRGLEEQRFYEMTKLRDQFTQLLKDSGLQDMADAKSRPLTGAARAQRYGQLKQLRELKKDLHRKGTQKIKVLKFDHEAINGESEDENLDLKDVDFKIKNDQKRLENLYRSSDIKTYKEIILLKIILCCGLYPQVSVGDEHNNYKPGSEQVFHTYSKPFTILHPNSVFASRPELLEINSSDILELPGFSLRSPASSKHQLLAYVSLLETNKPYLVNTLRVPAAQMLLLFAHNIDTNADFSIIVCDNFIELKFPDIMVAQNLIFQVVEIRKKWAKLLELRIEASKPSINDQDKLTLSANRIEKELTVSLMDVFTTEPVYSVTRLMAADIKVLHCGPGPQDMILSNNPFSANQGEPCQLNAKKGGVDLTTFLTYNCLLDTQCSVTTITTIETVCPYCDEELTVTILDRLCHMSVCITNTLSSKSNDDIEESFNNDPTKKEFYCRLCDKTLWMSLKDIFQHKKVHKG